MNRPSRLLALGVLASVIGCAGPAQTQTPAPTAAAPTPSPESSGPISSPSPSSPAAGAITLARSSQARLAADPAEATAAASAINGFGLDLYRRFAAASGNLVVSPASIAVALSMARVGARGATAAEMDKVLGGLGSDALAEAANALDAALAARTGTFPDAAGESQRVVLQIANALFPQHDMPLQPAFLDNLASRYGAGAWLVDYRADPEAARLAINAWVAEHTENRIPSILNAGDVNAAWRLAIANAIYLKAAWLNPFSDELTKPAAFQLGDGSSVSVPTMNGHAQLPYGRGRGWTAVELPYVGQQLAMLIVIPDDLKGFEPTLDTTALGSIVRSLKPSLVNLSLPRFDIESRADLGELLQALGMPTAFTETADFSGITTAERLRIASVIHQANLTVDEKGTEAAAATVVGFDTSGGGPEPIVVRVDRPFLVAIRDVPTGAVVFLARVANPSLTR